ncbi:MAG: hypothetical protein ACI8QY_000997 [bacterium]|jgi:hypothetical protein
MWGRFVLLNYGYFLRFLAVHPVHEVFGNLISVVPCNLCLIASIYINKLLKRFYKPVSLGFKLFILGVFYPLHFGGIHMSKLKELNSAIAAACKCKPENAAKAIIYIYLFLLLVVIASAVVWGFEGLFWPCGLLLCW